MVSASVHQPRMKVFALGLDEKSQSPEKSSSAGAVEENAKNEAKIQIESKEMIGGGGAAPRIVLAKAPRKRIGLSLLTWFVGAFCLVLLFLAISEVAYHRQRDQAFLRLKWAELRQRMLGYELLSQQQEIDRMAMEKQSQQSIEALPLRLSNDPIKPRIVGAIKSVEVGTESEKMQKVLASKSENDENTSKNSEYEREQEQKFGFLKNLIDKIRKHAESMGLSGDMQVHVVEVKPLKESSEESNQFDQALADGFGEVAMPHQDFSDDYDNGKLTFDRPSGFGRPRPFFGPFNRWDGNNFNNDYYEDQQRNFIDQNIFPRVLTNIFDTPNPMVFPNFMQMQQPPPPPMEVQTNQWNQPWGQQGPQQQHFFYNPNQWNQQFQQPAPMRFDQNEQRPWYMPADAPSIPQQQQQQAQWPQFQQNDQDWGQQQQQQQQQQMIPFQPNPQASIQSQQTPEVQWVNQNAKIQNFNDQEIKPEPMSSVISIDNTPLANQIDPKFNIKTWPSVQDDAETPAVAPDAQLEPIDDDSSKFLPIRSDDKPIDLNDDPNNHLFQIDDPSSFKH